MTSALNRFGSPPRARGLHVTLWVVQIALAAFFLLAGSMHAFLPIPQLLTMLPWVADAPEVLVRLIGLAELAGAAGLVLPAVTNIQPRLTALGAMGIATIMLLAIPVHLQRGELANVVENVAIMALALFVAWGRGLRAIPRA